LIAHALIASKIDYANSLLVGIPKRLLNRLQRIMNTSARIVMQKGKHDHITPLLRELHWLPVASRVIYKVALLVYKVLCGHAPTYLNELVSTRSIGRNTRSAEAPWLDVVRCSTAIGARGFYSAAQKVWNDLPSEVRLSQTLTIFKSRLKTHLFSLAFSC